MIPESDSRRHRHNPAVRLSEFARAFDAAVRDPSNHLRAAYYFSAIGLHTVGGRKIPAEAEVSVDHTRVGSHAEAERLARQALGYKGFSARDFRFTGKNDFVQSQRVQVVITDNKT